MKYLYEIFQTCAKNCCSDLTIALAMFLSDARLGAYQYGPEGLDYEAVHADYEAIVNEEREIREFMGRHHQKLSFAFKNGDRAAFDATVDMCVKEDEEADHK